MDLYPGVIANSVIQNVTLIDSEFNFMLFQGFNAVSTLNKTDLYLVDVNNVTIRDCTFKKRNSLIRIDSFYSKLNASIRFRNCLI